MFYRDAYYWDSLLLEPENSATELNDLLLQLNSFGLKVNFSMFELY